MINEVERGREGGWEGQRGAERQRERWNKRKKKGKNTDRKIRKSGFEGENKTGL